MFDPDEDQRRKTYQLCRLGFGINAAALLLACVTSLVTLGASFEPGVRMWAQQASWYQWHDTPIVWLSLFGTMLLFGRWDNPSWQRRSGLLLLMCMADIFLWFVSRGEALGLRIGEIEHHWLRSHLGEALGWSEFALLSSLSCDYLVHLGIEHARESDKSTRSMAATGAMVWMLLFCQQTNWAGGWPLNPRPMGRALGAMEAYLLLYGSLLIWTITLIQVTALVISATRQSTQVLLEMERKERYDDLLGYPSDPDRDVSVVPERSNRRD
jgi:hypothetical protein